MEDWSYTPLVEYRLLQTLFWEQPKLGCHLLGIDYTLAEKTPSSTGRREWKADSRDRHLALSNHSTLARIYASITISLMSLVVLKIMASCFRNRICIIFLRHGSGLLSLVAEEFRGHSLWLVILCGRILLRQV